MKEARLIENAEQHSHGEAVQPLSAASPPPAPIFLTVSQTAKRFPAFTQAAIRSLIFQAKAETKLEGARAIGFSTAVVRVPGQRKVLISEQHFIEWVSSGRSQQ